MRVYRAGSPGRVAETETLLWLVGSPGGEGRPHVERAKSAADAGDVEGTEAWLDEMLLRRAGSRGVPTEREIFIDNLLVRIHLIIEMILVDRPRAMGV